MNSHCRRRATPFFFWPQTFTSGSFLASWNTRSRLSIWSICHFTEYRTLEGKTVNLGDQYPLSPVLVALWSFKIYTFQYSNPFTVLFLESPNYSVIHAIVYYSCEVKPWPSLSLKVTTTYLFLHYKKLYLFHIFKPEFIQLKNQF